MIKYEHINKVGRITLNRPEKYHSFIREMALDLQDILKECERNKDVRSILLTSEGKAFCAGQDLSEFEDPLNINFSKVIEEHYNPIIRIIRQIEKPVIAAVNGIAAGAGASLTLSCDIIVAHENASFIQAFSKIGLIPDSGSTFFLPRLIGMQKAAALMMTGESISAQEAMDIGMIYKVFPEKEFLEKSWEIANKLSEMPTRSIGLTKRLLNASFSNNLEDQLNMEKDFQIKSGNTVDFQEGITSFLEKRKPEFKGE